MMKIFIIVIILKSNQNSIKLLCMIRNLGKRWGKLNLYIYKIMCTLLGNILRGIKLFFILSLIIN